MADGKVIKSYDYTYSSYSGCDIVASITIPQFPTKPFVIGELQTVSYSIHREVVPVRTLGRANPKGFTNGTRTIAGSLIFTVFDSNLVHKLVKMIRESYSTSTNSDLAENRYNSRPTYNSVKYDEWRIEDITKYSVMDEMPPFDITITFTNEYGNNSTLVIKGIVIVDEGQVMSIEDMITENTMSYMATDIQVLKSLGAHTLKPPLVTGKSDTALASVNTSGTKMIPSFDPAIKSYTIILPEGATEVPVITGTPRDKKSTIIIVPAGRIPGTTQIVVSGEDGTLTRYKFKFKTANQNAYLSALNVKGELVTGFNKDTYDYIVVLPYTVRSIPKVEGVAENSLSTVVVDRAFSIPGITSVKVTAEDGVSTKTYRISFVYAY